MLVVKIGGPAYRIGMGGGAASSVPSGSREGAGADLDFNAVQVFLCALVPATTAQRNTCTLDWICSEWLVGQQGT